MVVKSKNSNVISIRSKVGIKQINRNELEKSLSILLESSAGLKTSLDALYVAISRLRTRAPLNIDSKDISDVSEELLFLSEDALDAVDYLLSVLITKK